MVFICGAFIGCLYTCILADITMKYEHEHLRNENATLLKDLTEKNQLNHEWMQRYQQACDERDVLSDCIRAFHDEQECEGAKGDPIYSVCHDIMPAIDRDTTDLGNWSYCY